MSVSVLQRSWRNARRFESALRITLRVEGLRTVVVLRGDVDLATRPLLSEVLSRVVAVGVGDVVIDLAEAPFIDTATIHTLAACRELLDRRDRMLSFWSPSRLAARMLHLAGLSDLIETGEQAGP